jgi:hypothetical protein
MTQYHMIAHFLELLKARHPDRSCIQLITDAVNFRHKYVAVGCMTDQMIREAVEFYYVNSCK